MKKLWLLAPAMLLLTGCAEMREQDLQRQETNRILAEQPFLNGYNAGWLAFVAAITLVLVVAVVATATAYILVERRRSRERIQLAQIKAAQRSEVD